MNGEEALNAARAVFFEHRDEERYRYYGAGSALLFIWDGRCYVVTARHVMRQGKPEQLRISLDDKSNNFLRFDLSLSLRGEEQDWKDLYFFRIDDRVDPNDWGHFAVPVTLRDLRIASSCYTIGRQMWVSGYPNSHREIDYEKGHVAVTRCMMEATYEGPDELALGKRRIRIHGPLETFDGLSGAPVFIQASSTVILFAGILTQGSATSGIGHFVDVGALTAMLTTLPRAAA